jgi:hypothetical protein
MNGWEFLDKNIYVIGFFLFIAIVAVTVILKDKGEDDHGL